MGALLLVPIQVVAREGRFPQAPIVVAEAPGVPSSLESVPDIAPGLPAPGSVPPELPMPKVVVKEINLIGAIKVPADDLKGVMFTRVGGELYSSRGTFSGEIFQRDVTILQAAY